MHRIRIHGIDAPESGQAFGTVAKQRASQLIMGQTVSLSLKEKDRYGRFISKITLADGRDFGEVMISEGLAWHYVYYARNETGYADRERTARNAGVGLWVDKSPVPPWDWRRPRKVEPAALEMSSGPLVERATLVSAEADGGTTPLASSLGSLVDPELAAVQRDKLTAQRQRLARRLDNLKGYYDSIKGPLEAEADRAYQAALEVHRSTIDLIRQRHKEEAALISAKAVRIAHERHAVGTAIIEELRELSRRERHTIKAYLHSEDPEKVVTFLSRKEAKSGRYDELARRAYVYSSRDAFFPFLANGFAVHLATRNKIHEYLDRLIDLAHEQIELNAAKPLPPRVPSRPTRDAFVSGELLDLMHDIKLFENELSLIDEELVPEAAELSVR